MTDQRVAEWQVPLQEVPDKLWDVAVVGAGPAGATAAAHLSRRGLDVLVLERERFPRDKTCGDALIADTINSLKRLGLYDEVLKVSKRTEAVSAYSPSGFQVDVPGEFLTAERKALDRIIAQEAAQSGALCAHGRVQEIEKEGEEATLLHLCNSERDVRARVAVVATGANVSLLKPHGMVEKSQASAVAIRRYTQSSLDIDRMVISLDKSVLPGYAWIFPLPNGKYNVGCGLFYDNKPEGGVNLKEMLDSFVESFPLAHELLEKGEMVEPIQGATLRCGLTGTKPVAKGNIVAIGESIGATFPFTGEGIGKAMETAEIAAELICEALAQNDFSVLQTFPSLLEERLRHRYIGYEIAEKWLSRKWFLDLVAWRARRSERVREALAGVINETVDLRSAFSWKGAAKLVWGG